MDSKKLFEDVVEKSLDVFLRYLDEDFIEAEVEKRKKELKDCTQQQYAKLAFAVIEQQLLLLSPALRAQCWSEYADLFLKDFQAEALEKYVLNTEAINALFAYCKVELVDCVMENNQLDDKAIAKITGRLRRVLKELDAKEG